MKYWHQYANTNMNQVLSASFMNHVINAHPNHTTTAIWNNIILSSANDNFEIFLQEEIELFHIIQ